MVSVRFHWLKLVFTCLPHMSIFISWHLDLDALNWNCIPLLNLQGNTNLLKSLSVSAVRCRENLKEQFRGDSWLRFLSWDKMNPIHVEHSAFPVCHMSELKPVNQYSTSNIDWWRLAKFVVQEFTRKSDLWQSPDCTAVQKWTTFHFYTGCTYNKK